MSARIDEMLGNLEKMKWETIQLYLLQMYGKDLVMVPLDWIKSAHKVDAVSLFKEVQESLKKKAE